MKSKPSFTSSPYKIYLESHQTGSDKTIIMIPGAYHTGVCYSQTPNGRKGWTQVFADSGFNVIVTDLPGTGRSGFVPFDQINGKFLVEAYADLIRSIEGKITLLTHSLSGPIGFKLVEILPDKISELISIEPGLLGNVQEESIPISENENSIKINFKGMDFELNMKEMSLPSQQMADRLSKNCTKRFPSDDKSIEQYISSLQAVHPQLLYERFNIKGSQLSIDSYERLSSTRLLIITGTEDPIHKDEDYKISEDIKNHGIKIDHFFLDQKGIVGNGHMMMLEDNNEQIASLIIEWLSK